MECAVAGNVNATPYRIQCTLQAQSLEAGIAVTTPTQTFIFEVSYQKKKEIAMVFKTERKKNKKA